VKHLGDITKISGYTAPIVDCIIGGSPCQDLSVAGKRAGLDGERSGLYMEQIRIVKEMRAKDERNGRSGVDIRPRYMVWENVPGAFSSNKSEDFRIVLEELAKVKDENAVIPRPADGKWRTSGCILGDGWSIAWRVLDAQFWGVPQRRRRIALVADFGGHSAPEILFVSQSLSGHSYESKSKRKETSSDASRGFGADDREGSCLSFRLTQDPITSEECAPCISSGNSISGQASVGVVIGIDGYNANITGNKSATLGVNCGISTGRNGVITFEPGIASREGGHIYEGVSGTLRANAGDNQMATAYPKSLGFHLWAVCYAKSHYIVRRLTPLECERLQGYPDGWTNIGEWTDSNGKKRQTSDAARYKALGNSIALPPWKWVLKRLCACYERDATMASLFDGIGGFPYLWEQLNGKGTCLWASEIEEFPMAVTKVRIGE
jgi:DNA (cytosine-5)-methyltransferase 1